MVIQVEHVAFNSSTENVPTISFAHLEKFVVSNPVLKKLEFTATIPQCLLPALNQCLSVLYQQGRGIRRDHTELCRVSF